MKKTAIKEKYQAPENIRALFREAAEQFGDKVVYKYFTSANDVGEMTYNQLYETYNAIGTAISDAGLQYTKIAILSENRPEWVISYGAIIGSASVVIPLDKELLPDQIQNFLQYSETEAIFCSGAYVEKVIRMDLPKIKSIICFDAPATKSVTDERCVWFADLVKKGRELLESGSTVFADSRYDSSKMCALLFTSGTTGTSKGVMLSEDNITANIKACCNMIQISPDNVLLSVLPMHHTYELTAGQLSAIRIGVTICINNSLKYVMRNIKMFRPSVLVVVPLYVTTIKKKICDEIKNRKKENVIDIGVKTTKALRKIGIDTRSLIFAEIRKSLGGKLNKIVCGGAATDPSAIEWFENIGINISQGYGITECSPLVAVNPLFTRYYDSVGLPVPGTKVKIIDERDGKEVDLPCGEIGEICVKGPSVMLGYYNAEEETKAVFTQEGYFRTGDYGYLNEEGYLFITGRKKNIIVLNNGKNVYPEEIEEYLEKIESIKECVVVGRTKESGEVVLTALIYPDFDMYKGCSDEEIIAAMRAEVANINKKLASFKQVRSIELQKEEFEKTTTKKIIRYKLS